MNHPRHGRRLRVAAAVVAGLAMAGGIAYATIPDANKLYTACMLKATGTIRLIDPSLPATNLMSHCDSKLEAQISWNQQGQSGPPGAAGRDGANGSSVTSTALANGDGKDGATVTSTPEPPGANCANGGSKFTSAAGATDACNGTDGAALSTIEQLNGIGCASGGGTVQVTLNVGSIELSCVPTVTGLADLSLVVGDFILSDGRVSVDKRLITITNNGPDAAPNVGLRWDETQWDIGNRALDFLQPSQGTCSPTPGVVPRCALGTIDPGASVTVGVGYQNQGLCFNQPSGASITFQVVPDQPPPDPDPTNDYGRITC